MLDYKKYGFELLDGATPDVSDWRLNFKEWFVMLRAVGDNHTLYSTLTDTRIIVANRYKVETQEQLDFLIYNGRVGWIFEELKKIKTN